MKAKAEELTPALELRDITIRTVDWGGMTVERGSARNRTEPGEAFRGLPDDRCQCPHWGYVLKGQLSYRTANGVETFGAGDVYYIAPGHTPMFEAGTEYVEFSPTDELEKTIAVVGPNVEALVAAGKLA
jgi:hypothetical protein